MNKTLVASFTVLVLIIGIASNALFNAAEAKVMPKCGFNAAGGSPTTQYIKSSLGSNTVPIANTSCKQVTKQF